MNISKRSKRKALEVWASDSSGGSIQLLSGGRILASIPCAVSIDDGGLNASTQWGQISSGGKPDTWAIASSDGDVLFDGQADQAQIISDVGGSNGTLIEGGRVSITINLTW